MSTANERPVIERFIPASKIEEYCASVLENAAHLGAALSISHWHLDRTPDVFGMTANGTHVRYYMRFRQFSKERVCWILLVAPRDLFIDMADMVAMGHLRLVRTAEASCDIVRLPHVSGCAQ